MSIKELLRKSIKLLGTGSIFVGYHSYAMTIEQKIAQANEIEALTRISKELDERLDKYETEAIKNEVAGVKAEVYKADLTNQIENVNKEINKIETLIKDSSGDVPPEIEYHVNNLIKESKDLGEISTNLVDIFTGRKPGFLSDGPWLNLFKDYIDNLYVFFGQLSGEQIAAVSHFLSALVMLFCLMSVMAVVYGDFLLNYLKLEDKYPWLARFIQIRRKFVHFYLFIDFSLLIVLLLGQMYINIYALSIL